LWSGDFEDTLRPYCRTLPADRPLEADAPLVLLGVDSLDLVELIVVLETSLGVRFPAELLVPDAFATADSLWRLCLAAGCAAPSPAE